MPYLGLERNMDVIAKISRDEKIAFFQAFVRAAKADGDFDEKEKDFIMDLTKIYGMQESDKDEILKAYTDEELVNKVKKIKDRRVALELIKELCVLCHADSELSDKETLFIGRIGEAMGVEPKKVEQISNWIIDRIIWLEEEKLIFEKI